VIVVFYYTKASAERKKNYFFPIIMVRCSINFIYLANKNETGKSIA